MSNFPLTLEDVLASQDVLKDLRDQSDSFTAVEAVEFRLAAEKVKKVAQEAIDFCNMQLVKLLDGQPDIVREGRRFWVGYKSVKETVDHDAVALHVRNLADEAALRLDAPPVGENLYWVGVGAEASVRVMRDLYLSNSTRVKRGELDHYGIPRNVIDVQRGAKEVKTVPAPGEGDTP